MMVGNLCRFLVEIVGRVDSRLFWIEDGADLSVRCFDLCHEIELAGIREEGIAGAFHKEYHRCQRRMVMHFFDDSGLARIQLHN